MVEHLLRGWKQNVAAANSARELADMILTARQGDIEFHYIAFREGQHLQ